MSLKEFFQKSRDILKAEMVLVISTVFAFISMVFIPPSAKYIEYVDFAVLSILFCLMAVVAGFIRIGLFDVISNKLLSKTKSIKNLSLILVASTFFSSMLVTNDVALITFVPLTITLLQSSGQKRLIFIIVMETIAANIGSALTPIGNPQNLYIYSAYKMSLTHFIKIVAPICFVGMIVIFILTMTVKNGTINIKVQTNAKVKSKLLLIYYIILFAVSILTVIRIIDYRICIVVTLSTLIILDRPVLKKVDYSLILTFVAFFIFVGNLSSIEPVKLALSAFIKDREFISSVFISQVISNVPAAVMLSGFTDNINSLILGVNVGGLGTLVASLASLISFKLYSKSEGAKKIQFIKIFSIYNVLVLLVLIGVVYIIV